MSSSDEKIQAIKDRARREVAEKAQAEAASKRQTSKGKPETFGMGNLLLAVAVIVGLSYIYLSKEPDAPGDLDNLPEKAEAVRKYQSSAFAMAAIKELRSRGMTIDDAETVNGQKLSGNLYAATFTSDGKGYRLRGEYICDSSSLMPEDMQNPNCYQWK